MITASKQTKKEILYLKQWGISMVWITAIIELRLCAVPWWRFRHFFLRFNFLATDFWALVPNPVTTRAFSRPAVIVAFVI